MRCKRSMTPSSSRSIAVALASLAGTSVALADGRVVIQHDPSDQGGCAVRFDEPAIACSQSLKPTIAEIAGEVQSATSGDLKVFRLPQARGAEISTHSAPGKIEISWVARRAQATTTPKRAAPEIALTDEAIAPQPKEEPVVLQPQPGSAPQITLPGEAEQDVSAVPTAPAGDDSGDTLDGIAGNLVDKYRNDLGRYLYDFSIPESPGFTVLGLSPENVVRPRTLRELVFSLKNGVDDTGHYKTGLALDFAPLQLLEDDQSLIAELKKEKNDHYPLNTFNHALSNTTVSIATAKGTTSDDESVKVGIGLNIPLIDKSDGRADPVLQKCFDRVLDSAVAAIRRAGSNPEQGVDPQVLQPLEKDAENCFRDAPSKRWNASVWTVSLGYAMTSDSGKFSDSRPGSRGVWTSYAYGFDGGPKILKDNAQLLLHAKSLYKERVLDPDDEAQIVERDNTSVGLGFRIGKDNLNISLQGSYAWIDDRTHDRKDEQQRLALGVEYRVAKDVWLVASVGGTNGDGVGGNDSFVLGEVKFGSATGSQFDPRK